MTSQQHEIESSSVWLRSPFFNKTHELPIYLFIWNKRMQQNANGKNYDFPIHGIESRIGNMWRSAIAVAKWACKDDTIFIWSGYMSMKYVIQFCERVKGEKQMN